MKTGTLPVTLGKPDDQRVMHGIAEPMLASTVYTWCFMRTAGLPSPTATLEDRFNRRFSYCLINNNTFYISFQITNSYPSFPSTGRPQQQQQNNKASIKMHKGIKSPAKRPALLPSRQTQKNGWEGCGYQLWKPNVVSGHTVWTSSCGWMAGMIPTVTCGGAVDAIQVRRTCAVTATTEIEQWGRLIWLLKVKNKL